MKLTVHPRAQADLRATLDFLDAQNLGSSALRQKFVAGFRQTCALLIDNPHLGVSDLSTAQRFRESAAIRRFPVAHFPKHLVFYTLDEDLLTVIRVLHGARHPSLRVADQT